MPRYGPTGVPGPRGVTIPPVFPRGVVMPLRFVVFYVVCLVFFGWVSQCNFKNLSIFFFGAPSPNKKKKKKKTFNSNPNHQNTGECTVCHQPDPHAKRRDITFQVHPSFQRKKKKRREKKNSTEQQSKKKKKKKNSKTQKKNSILKKSIPCGVPLSLLRLLLRLLRLLHRAEELGVCDGVRVVVRTRLPAAPRRLRERKHAGNAEKKMPKWKRQISKNNTPEF
jgi:hypothetical protein